MLPKAPERSPSATNLSECVSSRGTATLRYSQFTQGASNGSCDLIVDFSGPSTIPVQSSWPAIYTEFKAFIANCAVCNGLGYGGSRHRPHNTRRSSNNDRNQPNLLRCARILVPSTRQILTPKNDLQSRQ